LTARQVNEIAERILEVGLDPNGLKDLFVLERHFAGTEREVVRLEHVSGAYFDIAHGFTRQHWDAMSSFNRRHFEWNGGEFLAEYEPGADVPRTTVLQVEWHQIRDGHLPLWLKNVHAETEAEDLWAILRRARVDPKALLPGHLLPSLTTEADNVIQLSAAEHLRLSHGLRRAIEEVSEQGLETAAQLADLRQRMERVEEASKSVPRKYLADVAFSAVASHFIGQALKSDTATKVWAIIVRILAPLLSSFLGGDSGDTFTLPPPDGTNV
jgi:hypothetical protein